MRTQPTANPRRWTVDLALGPRWWLLPLAAPLLLGLAYVYVEPHHGLMDFAYALLMMGLLSGLSFFGAALATGGARLPYRIAAVSTIFIGLPFLTIGFPIWFWIFLMSFCLMWNLLLMRFVHWRRWRVSLEADNHRGVSVAEIMIMTAGWAVVAWAWLAIPYQKMPPPEALAIWLLPTLAAGVVGPLLGSLRSRPLSVAFGVGLVLLTAAPFVASLHQLLRQYATGGFTTTIAVAGAVTLPPWAICYFHRCDDVDPAEVDATPTPAQSAAWAAGGDDEP